LAKKKKQRISGRKNPGESRGRGKKERNQIGYAEKGEGELSHEKKQKLPEWGGGSQLGTKKCADREW